MKVRTVTVGVTVSSWGELDRILKRAGEVGQAVSKGLQDQGYIVQTVRVATDPFESWLTWSSEEELIAKGSELQRTCEANGIAVISIGPATTVRGARAVPLILKTCPMVSTSVAVVASPTLSSDAPSTSLQAVAEKGERQAALLQASAEAMLAIAREPGTNGLGNFRFCASFCVRPGVPFFPAAYHDQNVAGPVVALGLENSMLAVQAFQESSTLHGASLRLTSLLEERLVPLEAIAKELANAQGAGYGGIDTSLNPSLCPGESLILAYEAPAAGLREGDTFGHQGTLAVSGALTDAVRRCRVKQVGYCGLMLPVLEDKLLAQRACLSPRPYSITDLLASSAVCGVGLDCVPVSGGEGVEGLCRVLRDVASIARRHDKQLSCRLFVVPEGKVGDMTTFDSPYLCNTSIFPLD